MVLDHFGEIVVNVFEQQTRCQIFARAPLRTTTGRDGELLPVLDTSSRQAGTSF